MTLRINSNPEAVLARREKIEDEVDVFKNRVVERFEAADAEKILAALDFMLKVHLPQKDRVDGRPFASHPLAVAERVMELSDNSELVIAALIHDGVEDQSDYIFVERVNRKFPDRNFLQLSIDETSKMRYKDIFKNWSFREIKDRFGPQVEYYIQNMTNHDFNSLAESLGLTGEDKQNFINHLYGEHVEDIMKDPELFTLKLADLSVNIDLHSLDPQGEKYKKLKRKYKSVIEAFLRRLQDLGEDHPLYGKRQEVMAQLAKIYEEQYM